MLPETRSNATMESGSICFSGEYADAIWADLSHYPTLLTGWRNVDPTRITNEDRARFLTLCQLIGFGRSKRHFQRYGGRLNRNRHLLTINHSIVEIIEEMTDQWLVLDGHECGFREFELGFFSGATVVYPLNEYGLGEYLENRLPPHDFEREHLISEEAFKPAAGAFIGGAIYLPTLPAWKRELVDYEMNAEPERLCRQIGKSVVGFLPMVEAIVNGPTGISFRTTDTGRLPIVVTAISGKGQGENTLKRLGFVRDNYPTDRVSKDRRYVLDLNDLNRGDISIYRRLTLLNSWSWFLGVWGGVPSLVKEIQQVVNSERKHLGE